MDAAEYILQNSDKICVFMKQGAGSYTTASGVEFSPEHPFQMIDFLEGNKLMSEIPERFRLATKEEVKEFYSGSKTGPKRMQMV